jgi:hypothetical protein
LVTDPQLVCELIFQYMEKTCGSSGDLPPLSCLDPVLAEILNTDSEKVTRSKK